MPTVVAKVTSDDGTEQQFGPVEVSTSIADEVSALLAPSEEARQESLRSKQLEQAQIETDARNEAAQAENDRREALAAQGIDPDAPTSPEEA